MPEVDDANLLELVGQLDLKQKVSLLTGQDSWSLRSIPEIGLRSIVMSDGPAGVRGTLWDERDPSCNIPSPTALAASWDPELVRAVGNGLGSEARRKGVDVILAPTINLQRTPYGGRHFEALSEDPLLTAELATTYVEGIQEYGVAATVKHYVANDSETDRFTVDVRVDERALRELYLLAFEKPIVAGHSWAVMSAYNSINGFTATESPLLTDPLLHEWLFDGVVVSDWTAVRSIESARHPQDIAMPGPDGVWGDQLVAAVRSGDVDEDVIDEKVLRILRLAARVGALEGVDGAKPVQNRQLDLRHLARSAAADGTVLLANDGILPLAKPDSIAVIGEAARFARTQGGGSATVVPPAVVSPLEGIQRRWPGARVEWAWGAVVQPGVAEFESGTYRTPDGEPGLLTRYIDGAGHVKGTEVRQSSSLVWFNGTSLGTTSQVIEFSFVYTPAEPTGELLLGVGGVADYEVLADGVAIGSGQLRTEPGDDPSSVVLNPPSAAVPIPMQKESVELTVRFEPTPGGMPDALALKVGLAHPGTDSGALISAAADLAARSDIAVVVVGTSAAVESEGFDRETLQLPGSQDALVRAVAAANPRTVVVINSGAPVILPWRDEVSALLAVWFPGQEFGDALADVLSGDTEPGGRLPMTWPAVETDIPVRAVHPVDGRLHYTESIHVGYRAWLRDALTPAYPFGHGAGYTEWELSGLTATPLGDDGRSRVSITVENLGPRQGKCVVQFYLERVSESAVERPVRWLAAFQAVTLDAKESARVESTLSWRRFAHWELGEWCLEPGAYRLIAGLSSADDRASITVDVSVGPPAEPTGLVAQETSTKSQVGDAAN